jgi:hypothetical protein
VTLLAPEDPPSKPSLTPRTLILATLVAAGLGLSGWLLGRREPEGPRRPPAVTRATPSPARSTPGLSASPSREASAPRPARTSRLAPLRVEADVPDASVFVDQRFVGKAPVDLSDLPPGPHRLNVSADGYALHGEEVDVGTEPRTIRVLFTEVRLAESLAVIHKHAVGSCRGLLTATPEGLAFEAKSAKDSFRAGFEDLAKLDLDYLGKTLRVALRSGRSYNFTVEGESADPLLVFQQRVETARKRL